MSIIDWASAWLLRWRCANHGTLFSNRNICRMSTNIKSALDLLALFELPECKTVEKRVVDLAHPLGQAAAKA